MNGSYLLILSGFLLSVLGLAWMSRQTSIHIQLVVYHLTRSSDAPPVALFLVFLPGVIVHEGAHWLMARLLGLKTGKFRVWPKRRGNHIGLGSVSVQSGGALADSIVGLAPLLVGTFLVALIGQRIFNSSALVSALAQGEWTHAFRAFQAILNQPDGPLWAYLLFTIGNAMMPSASDREPLKPLGLYIALASILYVGLGFPLSPLSSMMEWLTPTLQLLMSAFVFTIILDLIAIAPLYLIRLLINA